MKIVTMEMETNLVADCFGIVIRYCVAAADDGDID
jgi:hypothetical protein